MADLNVLLRREIGNNNKNWALVEDEGKFTLFSQYPPQNYTENAGAKIPEVSTVNNQEPFPQWVGGEGETASFTARIYRPDPLDSGSVRKDIENLKKATKKDPKLFRAPIFTFSWGDEISYKCFVVTVGGIQYDDITESGHIRGATFQVVLRKLEKIPQSGFTKFRDITGLTTGLKALSDDIGSAVSDLVDIIGGSLHKKGKTIRAKEGDTFESIAALEYGDALVGDILRRAQPEKSIMKAGDTIILVDDTEIFQIDVTPQSVALKNNETARTVRSLKFGERNRVAAKVY